jgi:GT2 family glycosyltransferase
LAANLAVRRSAFEGVGGFAEELAANEDIDLCWRLQLNGSRFVIAPDAVVAKRERPDFRQAFRQGAAYGRNSPNLFSRYRSVGAHRNLAGAAKSWAWLLVSVPGLLQRGRRAHWARTAGMRVGRLQGSVRQRVFFP